MNRLLKAVAALVCAFGTIAISQAQLATVTTAHVIKMGGVAISAGTVTFTPVNANGVPIAFAMGGGGLNSPAAFSCTITDGLIAGSCQIPDSAMTTPANILYEIQVSNTATRSAFTLQAVPNVTGTWDLSTYGPPAITTNVQPIQVSYGTGSAPNPCVSPSFYIRNASGGLLYMCVAGVPVLVTGSGGGGVTLPSITSIFKGDGSGGATAATAADFAATLATQTGCTTAGNAWNPATNTCIPSSGGGVADPGANGIMKRTALNTTAPAIAGIDYVVPTAINIKAAPYYASGSSYATTTTGTTAPGTSVSVTSCGDFASASGHQGVYIAGAGASGANYIGTVTSCTGTAMVVTPATSTSVGSGAVVQHDDTAAWQAALNTVNYDVSTNIVCPDGTYQINGPFQSTGTANGILLFPTLQYWSTPILSPAQLSITGDTPPVRGATVGCILKTGQSGSGALFSTYAVDSGSPWGNQSNVQVYLTNVVLRSYDNPNITMWNGFHLSGMWLHNVFVDTGLPPNCGYAPGNCTSTSTVPPTHTGAIGIVTPELDHYGDSVLQNVSVYGYYTGLQAQEHTFLDGFWANFGFTCINFNQPTGHAIVGVKVNCERNQQDLIGSADDIEISMGHEGPNSDGGGGIIVNDGDGLHGVLNYEAYAGAAPTINGGLNLQIRNLNTNVFTLDTNTPATNFNVKNQSNGGYAGYGIQDSSGGYGASFGEAGSSASNFPGGVYFNMNSKPFAISTDAAQTLKGYWQLANSASIGLAGATPSSGHAIVAGSSNAFSIDANGNTTALAYHETLTTPASSSATCSAGDFTDDTGFHYVCTAANTWKRVALTTF